MKIFIKRDQFFNFIYKNVVDALKILLKRTLYVCRTESRSAGKTDSYLIATDPQLCPINCAKYYLTLGY